MTKSRLMLSSALAAAGSALIPAVAHAQQPETEQDLRRRIEQLEAQVSGLTTVVQRLSAAQTPRAPAAPAEPAKPKSATELVKYEPPRESIKRPGDMPACDTPGANGVIGDYMLRMEDADRQKKESTYTDRERETNRGVNAFVYHCLGLTRATDYESTTNLSAQFTASKGSDSIEAAITRTARGIKKTTKWNKETKANEEARAATYNRYSLGGFGRTGSDGSAPLIDLTTSNFASGIGVVAGFEWGRMPARTVTEVVSDIHGGIAKARQECVAAHSVVDPLTTPTAEGRPQLAPNPLASCEGNELVKWMAARKRANQYWTSIISPLWGGTLDKRESFAGVQLRYAFQDLTYRPVVDPATGEVIVSDLPPSVTIHPEPYSIKFYGGINRPIMSDERQEGTIGLTGSLTYRREVDFIGGTAGKTICTPARPGATFDICSSDQKLAAPYDTKGFVAGIALNLQSRRFWYLPPIAIAPRFTYAFDTKRSGIELPFYFLTDADGKLNSGVQYTCRFRGETPEGFELKKSCNVNLFVGTSFDIGRTP